MNATQIVDRLLEAGWDTPPPLRFSSGDEEEDTRVATRSAFTAWQHALNTNRHDPRLWRVIQGSVYEPEYRRRFLKTSS